MTTLNQAPLPAETAAVIGSMRRKGIQLWADNGRLRYRAPKGALSPMEVEILRAASRQIVAHLESSVIERAAGQGLISAPRLSRAPLTFAQQAHWNMFRLSERRVLRGVAFALELRGPLAAGALRDSVAEVVRRHDALRAQITGSNDSLMQAVAEPDERDLDVEDLSRISEPGKDVAVKNAIDEFLLERIDVASDPLFAARLLRLGANRHVLIIAMEHIVSDGFSLGILLGDLLSGYEQISSGTSPSLPPVPVQLTEYAVWQANVQRPWIEQQGRYWSERLAGCGRVRFPEDRATGIAPAGAWDTMPVRIGEALKSRLQRWARLNHTTSVMGVFTAYVALVLRWCNVKDAVFQFQTDGRDRVELERTVGLFTAALLLRLELFDKDRFIDLLRRVTSEYCSAHAHADHSYIAAQNPVPELTKNTRFNWLPRESGLDHSSLHGRSEAISCSPVQFAHPRLRSLEADHEPSIFLWETADEIQGKVYFPTHRFSRESIDRFGRSFLLFIAALVGQPEGRVTSVALA